MFCLQTEVEKPLFYIFNYFPLLEVSQEARRRWKNEKKKKKETWEILGSFLRRIIKFSYFLFAFL